MRNCFKTVKNEELKLTLQEKLKVGDAMICFLLLKVNLFFTHIIFIVAHLFNRLTFFPSQNVAYLCFIFIIKFTHCANFIIAPFTSSYLNGRKHDHRHCRLTRNGTCLLLELTLENLQHYPLFFFYKYFSKRQKSLTSSQSIFL